MRLPFGQLRPDLPPLVNQKGLIEARNMIPKTGGYDPLRGLAALSGATVLTARPRGSISGIDPSGSGFLYAGEGTKLWVQRDAGMTDISKASGYALGPTDRWDFAKFGNRVYAVTLNEAMQQHVIGSPTVFQDVPQFAPRARHIETVGNFLMTGNIYDPLDGPQPDAVSWSAIQNGLLWPDLTTDDAAQVQAGKQALEGNGGAVQDVVSAAEVGCVFQERAIHRFDYHGSPAIFEKNRVVQGIGMLVPHSGVAFKRGVFFIAEDGFRVFDLTTTHAIGKDRMSQTFLDDLDRLYMDRVECGKDPDRSVIWTIYPGSGHTGGRPNKAILWDFELDKFSTLKLDLEGLIVNTSDTAASIDAPASAGDPDDIDDASGENSFDDRPQNFGSSRMGAFSTTYLASDFSGAFLEGLIETGDIEGAPTRFFFIDGIRPLVDGRKVEAAVAEMERRTDDVVFGPWVQVDQDGEIPFRSDARYHRIRLKLPPGWRDAVGIDIAGSPSGMR